MSAEMAHHRGAAVLVVSDRVAAGVQDDASGPALIGRLEEAGWGIEACEVSADDIDAIAETLARLADDDRIQLLLTSGGTGLALRDVTPDATRRIADREVPGIAEALRARSLEQTPHAMLSRATSAIRGQTLIVNLPGSPRGACATFETLAPVLDHAIALLRELPVGQAEHRAADRS
jgi:molybdenum cofactor synthesis domain-containing protein